MAPKHVMAPERWDRLLRTAAHEFATRGYERASLNRIIGEVGLSKGSFYHFVDSKEHLFEAVLTEFGPALIEAVRPPAAEQLAADFWGSLEQAVERLLEASAQEPVYALLGRMMYLPGAPGGADSALGRGAAGLDAWLQQVIEVGRDSGEVRADLPADLQARALLAVLRAFDEWSLNHLDAIEDPEELLRLTQAQLAAVRRLIGTEHADGTT